MTKILEKVAILGSGNWGSAIAKIVGRNVMRYPDLFARDVRMWTIEEMVNGSRLTDLINTTHENPKYLPGIQLPTNIIAEPQLLSSIHDATLIVFVFPHNYVGSVCEQIRVAIHPKARAISLIKGVDSTSGSGMNLISDVIASSLNIDVSVLMGANIANEVAREQFCETTIGSANKQDGSVFKKLFDTPNFRVSVVEDVAGVELCGALKNVVAIAAGLVDGLKLGDNTKAAIIRIGLLEMRRFSKLFYEGVQDETFFESCGVADVITTCFGGRNRKVAEAFVLTGKPFDVLERDMLNGQKLQGTGTALDIHEILTMSGHTKEFPLFTTVYRVVYENVPPIAIVKNI